MPNPSALNFQLPRGGDFLVRQQRDIERTQEEQAAARTLARSQIGNGGTLQVDGAMNVSGSLTVSGTLSVPTGSLNTAGSINAGDDLTAGDMVIAGGQLKGATLAIGVTGKGFDAAGSVAATDVTATGSVTAGTGIGNFPAGVSSLDARNRVLSTGYAGAWIDSSGRFGIQPSSIRYKKDVAVWHASIEKLLELRAVTFRYRAAIDSNKDQPKQLGFIAEEVRDLGFPEFVFYDEDGEVQGLNYDRMVVALLVLAKFEHDRVTTVIDDLAEIKERLAAAGL